MNIIETDIAIIGSGFGGSLTALLARQIGLRSVVIDRARHPRFAIGESSTPLANLVLEDLARRYDLPRLLPLTNYADWIRTYPNISRGLKRGFSYFGQRLGEPYVPQTDHGNELLVAASHDATDADTHWYRAEFDHFIAREAVAGGVLLLEETLPESLTPDGEGWCLQVRSREGEATIRARFLVDASGEGGWVAQRVGARDLTSTLATHSRAVFAHFADVAPWQPLYEELGGHSGDHPFPCDAAALHHVFEGGWMYQLRFDNGLTSAGFLLDPRRYPVSEQSAGDEFEAWLQRLPSVGRQFQNATPVSHGGQIVRSQRLQRRLAPAAGSNWALLPHAAGFIDPLHSTGLAHTLFGIERLVGLWEQHWGRKSLATALIDYDRLVQAELRHIDGIVAASYAGFADFPRMVSAAMFYFATAIWSEHRRRSRTDVPRAFLCADEPTLQYQVAQCLQWVQDSNRSAKQVAAMVQHAIAPINRVGLGRPECRNMIPYTG